MSDAETRNAQQQAESEADAQRLQAANEQAQPDDAESESSSAKDSPAGHHQGNDTSKMTLLDQDITELVEHTPDPDPSVREALDTMAEIPVRERINEADS